MRARIAVLAAAIAAVIAFQAAVAVPESTAGAPSTNLTLELDCDLSTSGIQAACTTASSYAIVNVVVTNNTGAPVQAGSFDFTVYHPNLPRLAAFPSMGTGLGHNGNPNFDFAITSMSWACNTPLPDEDTGADSDPDSQQSFLGCVNNSANGFVIAPGASVALARVGYYSNSSSQIPANVALTIQSAIFRDETQTERGSCAAVTVAMDCNGAMVSVVTPVTLSLDCDANTAGIQSECTQFPGAMFDVDVVATNVSPAAFQLGSLNMKTLNPDISRLIARTPGMDLPVCDPTGLNCNPDFNQATVTGAAWACSPPPPSPDDSSTTEPGQDSFIGCHNGGLDGPFVPAGASIVLWKIHYRVPAAAPTGDVPLTLYEGGVYDESFGELGTCDPPLSIPIACNGATITIAHVSMSIDCNASLINIQSNCMVSNTSATRDVRVVLTNHTSAPIMLGAFDIYVLNPDDSRLFAPVVNPPGTLNDNPDAAPAFAPETWSCGPPGPWNDTNLDSDPASQQSAAGCNGAAAPLAIPALGSAHLVTVKYNIVSGADPGAMTLAIERGDAYNGSLAELGSCGPVLNVAMPCNPATVTLYCPIDMADVNNDGRVNVADMGITAVNNGVLPAPPHLDQNFDGIINVADRGVIASQYGKFVTQCP